jgi:ligand-binding SRPBCC domain-containing protein
MATYEREMYVDAPLEEVWEFHSRVEGLEALTPGWMGLAIQEVRGSDGEPDPEILEAGAEIDMALRPLGVPSTSAGSWTSVITERAESDERGLFKDEMRGGPFVRWVHVHQFRRKNGGTQIRDTVHYELPKIGRLSPFAVIGFEPMFRYRHQKTKELLEG